MKLYIRQKVFSWVDRFTVKEESGEDKYFVEGEFFSWGKKLHVYDGAGNEAAFIQQKVWSFLPKFMVFLDGEQVAEIVKEFTFLRPRYRIDGLGWQVDGSFMAHDYEITRDGRPIVTIHKEWMTWGDCYELDIEDERDEVIALSVVLAIDCVLASEAAGAAASSGGD
ncbi:MAG TPA: LURP-one-related family protein [Oscillospiraceae bacterium]|nr:LURP-one-related family protein [Oscillospiraceae bacterium]HNW03925.1 LURP-one-related family protein [Oscillospiraceae bacterium]